MGMSAGGNRNGVQSEINVTPLIDVLLVLLIIFLVVMPIMMKMETLQVPRKIDDVNEMPDPNSIMLTLTVDAAGGIEFDDNGKKENIQSADMLRRLRPRLEAMKLGTDKVVFIDFQPNVKWGSVITTMDTIRSMATDVNRDEIKVALKIKDDAAAASGDAGK